MPQLTHFQTRFHTLEAYPKRFETLLPFPFRGRLFFPYFDNVSKEIETYEKKISECNFEESIAECVKLQALYALHCTNTLLSIQPLSAHRSS